MKKINAFLAKIPALLSSKVSIFIYIFLFVYLVLFALLALLIPAISPLAPSSTAQLVLGNYTNVLSALGASIAAGAGTAIHQSIKSLHVKHSELQKTLDEVHKKIDDLKEKHGEIKENTKN